MTSLSSTESVDVTPKELKCSNNLNLGGKFPPTYAGTFSQQAAFLGHLLPNPFCIPFPHLKESLGSGQECQILQ